MGWTMGGKHLRTDGQSTTSGSGGEMELAVKRDSLNILQELVRTGGQRFEAMLEQGESICRDVRIETVLNAVRQALLEAASVERCFVARVNKDHKLEPLITHKIDLRGRHSEWPVSWTILNRVVQENISVLASDAKIDTSFASAPSVGKNSIRSVIAVPYGPSDSCEGVVYLDNKQQVNCFSPIDLLLVTQLARYIYEGIHNADAHTEIVERHIAANERLQDRGAIIGRSAALQAVLQKAKRLAETGLSVVLFGESGVGKERIARLIHDHSGYRNGEFIDVNLAALAGTVVESELFGHVLGAFTDAVSDRPGVFEMAHKGSLFLDEIGEAPLSVQVKILRVLQEQVVYRVGGRKAIPADVRVISATHKNLKKLVEMGGFREDLFYRIAGEQLRVPPLRERAEDIPLLIDHFLHQQKSPKLFTPEAYARMQLYNWPGNIRQLKNEVEAMSALCDDAKIDARFVAARLDASLIGSDGQAPVGFTLQAAVEEAEKRQIVRILKYTCNNRERAAELLDISKPKLYRRIEQFQLDSLTDQPE